jgi:2-polyprenyl-6-methoxyphenol hydroxylase-like FAD-dependent oxidoreductase
VATALDPSRVRENGLGPTVAAILDEAGFPPVPHLASLPWRGTPLLTRHASRPAAHRAFALGDAAGYVEPFTGEGMSWALAAGAAVAPLAAKACRRWHGDLAMHWSVRYRQTVGRRQRACRIVADVLRRPRMVRGVVAALAWAPTLAAPLVRYLNVRGQSRPWR